VLTSRQTYIDTHPQMDVTENNSPRYTVAARVLTIANNVCECNAWKNTYYGLD